MPWHQRLLVSLLFSVCLKAHLVAVISSEVDSFGELGSYRQETLDTEAGSSIFSCSTKYHASSAVFSANQMMYHFNNWPNNDKIYASQLFPASDPKTKEVRLMTSFCNDVATSLLTTNDTKLYIMSSDHSNDSCFTSWNLYEIDIEGNVIFMEESPFSGFVTQPLHWVTFDEIEKKFIYFIPDANVQQGSIKMQNETFPLPFMFYSIDWIDSETIIGPCEDQEFHFGLCWFNVTSGEATQIIQLLPSYNPKLVYTYLSKEKNSFVFTGQADPTNAQRIQIYLANLTNWVIDESLSFSLPQSNILSGVYIFPTEEVMEEYSNTNSLPVQDQHPYYFPELSSSDMNTTGPNNTPIILGLSLFILTTAILLSVVISLSYFLFYHKFTMPS